MALTDLESTCLQYKLKQEGRALLNLSWKGARGWLCPGLRMAVKTVGKFTDRIRLRVWLNTTSDTDSLPVRAIPAGKLSGRRAVQGPHLCAATATPCGARHGAARAPPHRSRVCPPCPLGPGPLGSRSKEGP